MSQVIKEYEFKKKPEEIEYFEEEPLELNENFIFYHNKNKFRKDVTRLQNLFKEFTKNPLIATGIRDSYLKEELTENYLLILFTTGDTIKDTSKIIESYLHKDIEPNHFYLITASQYMLLLTKDMNGLISGIDAMEEIFKQTFEHYLAQKKFDEFVKISQFQMYGS